MADFCRKVLKRMIDDKAGAFAAQSAYFVLLSTVPFTILLLQLLKLLPVGPPELMELAELALPEYVLPFFSRIVDEFYRGTAKLISISAIAALWASSNAMSSIAQGLNTISTAEKTRTWVAHRLWSLLYTLVMIFGLALTLIFMVFWKNIVAAAVDFMSWLTGLLEFANLPAPPGLPNIPVAAVLNSGVTKLVFIGILTLLFALMFQTLPERKLKFVPQIPGALFAALGWVLSAECLKLYVNVFHGFSIYGSLATVTLVLLWLYICFLVQMIGAEINEELRFEAEMKKNGYLVAGNELKKSEYPAAGDEVKRSEYPAAGFEVKRSEYPAAGGEVKKIEDAPEEGGGKV